MDNNSILRDQLIDLIIHYAFNSLDRERLDDKLKIFGDTCRDGLAWESGDAINDILTEPLMDEIIPLARNILALD